MIDDLIVPDDAATALDPDEVAGLIPTNIMTRADLDEAEFANILDAMAWAERRPPDVLDELQLRRLHREMFANVWKWAGQYRQTERNIGVPPHIVQESLRALLDDVRFWLEHDTYDLNEAVARFHHQLVKIHPFSNGNGRHARLAADLLLRAHGEEPFSWGGDSLRLNHHPDARRHYIDALRAADSHQLEPLLAFVRS